MMNTPTKAEPQMKRYYIAAGLLVVAALGLVVAVTISDAPKRHDRVTAQKFEDVMSEVGDYAENKKQLPDNINQLYAKNAPSGIEYQRLSLRVFMVCATFKQSTASASANEDTLNGAEQVFLRQQQQKNDGTTYRVIDRFSYYSIRHAKGRNCYISENTDARQKGVDIQTMMPDAPGESI